MTDILKNNNHVFDVEVPEKVENVDEKEVFDAFRKQLAENKPKKGFYAYDSKKWSSHTGDNQQRDIVSETFTYATHSQ